jgi:SAM-dependent methyltransferase
MRSPPTAPMQRLLSMITAHYQFAFLASAVRFDLFNALASEPGLTREGVAKLLQIEDQPAKILLLGCTAYGLLRKEGERYFNTPISELLTRDPKDLPFAFVPFEDQVNFRPMTWMYESLKANTNIGMQRSIPGSAPTLYGRLAELPELEAMFHNMMSAVTRAVAQQLVDVVDLSGTRRLLDVGGGAAVNARAIARRWPGVEVTILDLPSIAGAASAAVAADGLSDRIKVADCDILEADFPAGYDFVLFSHFLPIWSAERIQKLIGRAFRALAPRGKCLLIHPVQDDDRSGPELAATLSAYFHVVASGEGMVYTDAEYEQWLTEAGFRVLPRRRMRQINPTGDIVLGERELMHGVIEAIKD